MKATGHIKKRVNKSGEVAYQIVIERSPDPVTGKRNREFHTVKGVTKKQAEKLLHKKIDEIESGLGVKQSSMTVKSWMEQWLDLYCRHLAESTKASYRDHIDNYIVPCLGKAVVGALSANDIQGWVNSISEESPVSGKPLSPKTVKNIFLNLDAAMKKAYKMKMIKWNPCEDVVLPKQQKHEARVFDDKQIKAVLKAAEGTDMYVPIVLGLSTGLRRGEFLALRWQDVSFEEKCINVVENRVIAGGRIVVKEPKTSSGKRSISIGDGLCELLKMHRSKYIENKLKLGSGFTDSDLVICQPNGKAYNPDAWTKKWSRFLESHGLEHISWHEVRHSSATQLLANGVDPKTIQARLGHSNVTTTLSIYSHVIDSMARQAADTIDAVVLNKASG